MLRKKWRRALKLGLGVKELTFPEFCYITYKEGWKTEIVLKERNEALNFNVFQVQWVTDLIFWAYEINENCYH